MEAFDTLEQMGQPHPALRLERLHVTAGERDGPIGFKWCWVTRVTLQKADGVGVRVVGRGRQVPLPSRRVRICWHKPSMAKADAGKAEAIRLILEDA